GGQTTGDGASPSAGHVVVVPSQVSSRSHGPAAARQTVPAFAAGCWQLLLEPSHTSAVHGVPSSVQSEPAAFLASAGQVCPGSPPQGSAMAHSPAAARQAKGVGTTT